MTPYGRALLRRRKRVGFKAVAAEHVGFSVGVWVQLAFEATIADQIEWRRSELAATPVESTIAAAAVQNGSENIRLMIWRLLGGGFAVGRLSGSRGRIGEQELPVVYMEMDGGFNNGAAIRRVAWSMRAGGGMG
ncbi:hypothetical protein SO802_017724 [Lithocarpus litseifolius]|uniref:DUF1117 domain-containing protein n=1 Tax=Lithocarpus litseifolius TaxID=425828 RepID=A0AAW2CJA4_9ROSI